MPSIVTPYEYEYSDFFFSGHCGILMIIALEWKTLGQVCMVMVNAFFLIIVAFNLLALRVHYWIDLPAGIIFAHYLYQWIEYFLDEFEIFAGTIRLLCVEIFSKSSNKIDKKSNNE